MGPCPAAPSLRSARRSTRCCVPTSPARASAPGPPSASCSTAPGSAPAGGQPQPQSPATSPPGAGDGDVGAVCVNSGVLRKQSSRSGGAPTPLQFFGLQTQKEPQSKVEDHMVPRGAAPQISGWTEPRAPHGGQQGASLLLPRGEQDLMLGAHSTGGHVMLPCPVSVGACVDQEGRLER